MFAFPIKMMMMMMLAPDVNRSSRLFLYKYIRMYQRVSVLWAVYLLFSRVRMRDLDRHWHTWSYTSTLPREMLFLCVFVLRTHSALANDTRHGFFFGSQMSSTCGEFTSQKHLV